MYESGNKGKECLLSKLLLLTKIIVDKCAIVDNYSVFVKNSEVCTKISCRRNYRRKVLIKVIK